MSGGEASVAQPHRTRHSAQATQAHPQHAVARTRPCRATHTALCACVCTWRVHGSYAALRTSTSFSWLTRALTSCAHRRAGS